MSTVQLACPDGDAYLIDFAAGKVVGKYTSHSGAMRAAAQYGDGTDVLMTVMDATRYGASEIGQLLESLGSFNVRDAHCVPETLMAHLREMPHGPVRKHWRNKEMPKAKTPAGGEAAPRNGNTQKVHEIADKLYAKHGGEITRKMVLEECVKKGIPAGTASTQWQKWRQANGAAA